MVPDETTITVRVSCEDGTSMETYYNVTDIFGDEHFLCIIRQQTKK